MPQPATTPCRFPGITAHSSLDPFPEPRDNGGGIALRSGSNNSNLLPFSRNSTVCPRQQSEPSMSEPVPSDENLNLQKVRERVLQLAREIEQLSGQDLPPQKFFQEFLVRVITAIGAKAGAVWVVDESGRLSPIAHLNLNQIGLFERPGAQGLNEKILMEVLNTGEARTLSSGGETQLPTEHVLVLAALHREKKCVGVVQLFQRHDVPVKAQSGYMQFLEQMCGYASRFLEGRRRSTTDSADLKNQFWTDFEQFSLRLQRSLDEQEVADAVASDSRPLLGCDRVSVATRRGRSVQVRAVSGQSSVNARANLIAAMRRLASSVIDMGETLTYTGRIEGLAPQIEEPLAAFVQESGSRMVMIIPTFENAPLVRKQGEEADREQRKKRLRASGCIIIEQMAESEPQPQLEQRAELIADHAGAALWNSRLHNRIFGLRLWTTIGLTLEWFRGRRLMISLAVLAVAFAIVAAMTLIRLDYPVTAEGFLRPVEQHAIFATWDGQITREGLHVDENTLVEKDQLLITLANDELDGQVEEARANLEKQNNLILAKNEEINVVSSQQRSGDAETARSAETNRQRLLVELARLEGDRAIAADQLRTLENRRNQKLRILAPAAGRVPNPQLRQMLEDRPVRTGDYLFDVMNEQGPWHMELLVEEKRMGHLLRALRERQAAGESTELPGSFVITSSAEEKYTCRLTRVATRSTTDSEMGTVFELIAVADDGQTLPPFSIGTEVSVKIYCGKTTLAYWCFGDIVEFLQKYLWL